MLLIRTIAVFIHLRRRPRALPVDECENASVDVRREGKAPDRGLVDTPTGNYEKQASRGKQWYHACVSKRTTACGHGLCLWGSIFLAFFAPNLYAQQTVTLELNSGQTVEGPLLEETDKYFKISNLGSEVTYWKDEVKAVHKEEAAADQAAAEGEDTGYSAEENPFNDPKVLRNLSSALATIKVMLGDMMSGQIPEKRDIQSVQKQLEDLEQIFGGYLQ